MPIDWHSSGSGDAAESALMRSVLSGGGEMGALMRAFDWSQTPLGPVSQWPQSLRIAVTIVLGTGYPMLICWGSQYTMIYNDGYRLILGKTDRGRDVSIAYSLGSEGLSVVLQHHLPNLQG